MKTDKIEINRAQVFEKIHKDIRIRGYCESCGTFDLHGRVCVACGFDFGGNTGTHLPAGDLAPFPPLPVS